MAKMRLSKRIYSEGGINPFESSSLKTE